jgi:hypothetical protein
MPYRVSDLAGNGGGVSMGIDHYAATFAANAIRSWWMADGARAVCQGQQTADCRRWRRQQWLTRPIAEDRAAETGR